MSFHNNVPPDSEIPTIRVFQNLSHRARRFIRGPLPVDWFLKAVSVERQPTKTLHVGLLLWFRAGLERSQKLSRSPSASLLKEWGISRKAYYRALEALEAARLISIVRLRGRKPIVTLLDAEQASDAGHSRNNYHADTQKAHPHA